MTPPLRKLAIIYTTFPVRSETFLQREFIALSRLDLELEIWSLHGGEAAFSGFSVRRFSKWRLWRLVYRIPREWVARPRIFLELLRLLLSGGHHPSNLNLGENLLGIGFAIVEAPAFRAARPDLIHGAWGSLPAMAAWLLSRLCSTPFTFEAHAYDLFEHGGDWFLREKIRATSLIRTSTASGRTRLLESGAGPDKVRLVRRGLLPMPGFPERESVREPIRFLSVGRLVEKKGFLRQIGILAALRESGIDFSVRVVGDGPLRDAIRNAIESRGLGDRVHLTGWMPADEVARAMAGADVLLHTGRIARSGDRDGLPNVVGEAMAAGAIILSAEGEGVSEAVIDGKTGLLCPLDDDTAWIAAVRSILDHPVMAARLRTAARLWVETEFDATRNMAGWVECLRRLETGVNSDEGLF